MGGFRPWRCYLRSDAAVTGGMRAALFLCFPLTARRIPAIIPHMAMTGRVACPQGLRREPPGLERRQGRESEEHPRASVPKGRRVRVGADGRARYSAGGSMAFPAESGTGLSNAGGTAEGFGLSPRRCRGGGLFSYPAIREVAALWKERITAEPCAACTSAGRPRCAAGC